MLKTQLLYIRATPLELVKGSYNLRWDEATAGTLTLIYADAPIEFGKAIVSIEYRISKDGKIRIGKVYWEPFDKNDDVVFDLPKSEPIGVFSQQALVKEIERGPIRVYRVEGFSYSPNSLKNAPKKGDDASGKFASSSIRHQRNIIAEVVERKANVIIKAIQSGRTTNIDSVNLDDRYVFVSTILAEEWRPPLMSESHAYVQRTDGSELVVEKGRFIDVRIIDVVKTNYFRKAMQKYQTLTKLFFNSGSEGTYL